MVVPGFTVDAQGVRVNHPSADAFRFDTPSRVWSVQSVTAYGETVALSGLGRSPLKAKADLWAPGVALYFHHGISLKTAATTAPYLSWQGGSVGDNVPTPLSRWILVSFRDNQPPVMIAFVGKPESLKLVGKPGDWTLRSETAYAGWVRFVLPVGTTPRPTNSASALGVLVGEVAKDAARWSEPAPQFKGLKVEDSAGSITATWQFDKPGAVLPASLALAPLGGYGCKVLSSTRRLNSPNEHGPVTLCAENDLRVRFPVRRVPTGRSVALGQPVADPIATVSYLDVGGVAELALSLLQASSDRLARTTAEETLAEYLTESEYVEEPITGKRLPFAADGRGADLASAHALLMQAMYTTVQATSEPNSLLTSLIWRRDAYTWQLWADEPLTVRRAGALAALAGAICPETERRLDGALFEAGLAARRGLEVWRRRRGEIPKEPPLIEPLDALRKAVFGSGTTDPYWRSLSSEVRVYGDVGVAVIPEKGFMRLVWRAPDTKPMMLTFASAFPLEIEARSAFDRFAVDQALGFTVLRCTPKDAGPCEAKLKLPSWAAPLPPAAPAPRYSESPR